MTAHDRYHFFLGSQELFRGLRDGVIVQRLHRGSRADIARRASSVLREVAQDSDIGAFRIRLGIVPAETLKKLSGRVQTLAKRIERQSDGAHSGNSVLSERQLQWG
jgi:hypothetical protein